MPDALSGVNERELQKEFDVIAGSCPLFFTLKCFMTPPFPSAVLDDVKGNWERRLSCLRRLQSLALGSLAECSIAPSLVKLVRSGLVKGIRSSFQYRTNNKHYFLTLRYQRPAQRYRARGCRSDRLSG